MTLHERVEQVRTREDFISFAQDILQDLKSHPEQWENDTLPRYLEALAGWVTDMDGWYANREEAMPAQPSWEMMARILLAARVYE